MNVCTITIVMVQGYTVEKFGEEIIGKLNFYEGYFISVLKFFFFFLIN